MIHLFLFSIGVVFVVVLYRWPDQHPVDCLCERCRHSASDRYIDELLAERERRDREGRVVRLWGDRG
jgi:hypothetical protein